MAYVRAVGVPLYNFQLVQTPLQQLQPQPQWQLRYLADDPLCALGLAAVSERGRLHGGGGGGSESDDSGGPIWGEFEEFDSDDERCGAVRGLCAMGCS